MIVFKKILPKTGNKKVHHNFHILAFRPTDPEEISRIAGRAENYGDGPELTAGDFMKASFRELSLRTVFQREV